MTQDYNTQKTGKKRKSGAAAGLYSTGFLSFLLLLLVSVGASQTMTHGGKQVGRKKKPTTSPNVKVMFHGLFFLSFSDEPRGEQYRTECRIGILSTRQDHLLYVTYRDESGAATTFTFPHAALQRLGDIVINKNPPEPQGVKIYRSRFSGRKGWEERPNRDTFTDENKHDFNWILDLEATKLHGKNIDERSDKLRPVLHIKTGEFRTGELSSPYRYSTVQDGVFRDFGFVASSIEANITLDRDREELMLTMGRESVCLSGRGSGCISPDITEIELNNLRPDDMDYLVKSAPYSYFKGSVAKLLSIEQQRRRPGEKVRMNVPRSDDFQIYYDDLLDISSAKDRFHFIPVLREPAISSPPFICYGVGGSR